VPLALALLLAAASPAAGLPKPPPIVARPIPFGAARRAQTAAYAARHYGPRYRTWRLVHPRVIVEHYTANTSFAATWNTFARDRRDPELHELPGVCAHFVVDRDGTIYQLVPVGTICRHTVGLNYTAIGIEHVGTSDAQVLGNVRQLRASLALTRWLAARFRIAVRDVVGHAESLTNRYHRELVPRLRRQTHGDFAAAAMRIYRARLRGLAG
jgi:N-acetyl-anhydromuramyl-L-alanine amidase AmpD